MIDGLGNLDAVCSATASRAEGGWRALDLRAWDGIDARLLPDRGLDCFSAWYRGVPLAWVSAVGERGPLAGRLRDDDWLRGFGGGLVATCGLRNVGAPSEGHGLHGEISHQPARDVRVARWVDGEQAIVSASAAVAEVSALGHRLELERTWTTRTGEGRLELVDVTRNLGPDPEPGPLLYHVNLGAPLWSAGATLAVDARSTTPRDEDAVGPWDRALDPIPGARERVFEHEVAAGEDGWCAATVDSPATGLRHRPTQSAGESRDQRAPRQPSRSTDPQLIEAYRRFAGSGAGLLISGNVMVDGSALEAQRNVVIEDERHLSALRRWAAVTEGTDARFILQLSHPGRQTMRGLSIAGRRQDVVAPSAVPLKVGGNAMFRRPRALTEPEILRLVERFSAAARVAAGAGFAGVQLHAAHGYLLSQFLSPLVNRRTDRWGGSLDNRMRLLLEVVRAVRMATPESFLIAVKLNSADFQRGGFDADDALAVAKALEREGVHLLEISGGTYETAAMVTGSPKRESTRAREADFLEFAERFAAELSIPLMLTGGFRTRQGMIDALAGGAVDVIGLARPIAHEPDFPRRILAGTTHASLARPQTVGHREIDDLLNSAWHQQQIARLGRGKDVRPDRSPAVALVIALRTTARDRPVHQGAVAGTADGPSLTYSGERGRVAPCLPHIAGRALIATRCAAESERGSVPVAGCSRRAGSFASSIRSGGG